MSYLLHSPVHHKAETKTQQKHQEAVCKRERFECMLAERALLLRNTLRLGLGLGEDKAETWIRGCWRLQSGSEKNHQQSQERRKGSLSWTALGMGPHQPRPLRSLHPAVLGENRVPQTPCVRRGAWRGNLAPNQGGNEQNQLRIFPCAGRRGAAFPKFIRPSKLSKHVFKILAPED